MTLRPGWDLYFLGVAEAIAERADCTRAKVGAVIVKHHRIVSTGYNGSPAGERGCLTDGACPRGRLHDELAAGINESAVQSGFSSYDTGPGACIAVHAEANAIIYAEYSRCRGATLYCTHAPCLGCMKLIRGAGIVQVIDPQALREEAMASSYDRFYHGLTIPPGDVS